MGERKVLNKYYPPDFDTIRLPKLPGGRPDQYVIRIMAPFTMRCLTCGNYVYKGRKFNSRKEDAKGEYYLGIQIYRFYIRCPECLSELTFKTDPLNADYVAEHGAVRTFQAERLAELEEQREAEEKDEEESNNPMLALENRTAESRREMDVLDALEEIRDWNSRNAAVKHEELLGGLISEEEREREGEEAGLTAMASKIFQQKRDKLQRLEDEEAPPTKRPHLEKPRLPGKRQLLSGLVVKKRDKRESGSQEGDKRESGSQEGDKRESGSQEGDKRESGSQEGDKRESGSQEGDKRESGSQEGGKGQGKEREGEGEGDKEKTQGLGLLCGYSDTSSSDSD